MTAGFEPPVLTPASPRELKGMIKDWRRGRATRNLMEAFTDAYVAVIGALMVGAMVVNVVLRAQRNVAACDAASCLSARAVLPWAAFAAAVAVALTASRLFGPVLASAAEGFWLLDAPISRVKLLSSRLVAALAIALLGGVVMGALVVRPDRVGAAGGRGLGRGHRSVGRGGRGVRRRSAGVERHRLPTSPRTSSACSRWPPWWLWSGCRPAGSRSGCPTASGSSWGRSSVPSRLRCWSPAVCWPSGGSAGSGAPG